MFSEKLDILMNITKTSNTSLALALSVVPSYISRLRSGKRSLPKNTDILQPMSEYFAERILTEFQKTSVINAIGGTNGYPEDKNKAAKLLFNWMQDDRMEVPELLEVNSKTAEVSGTACYYGYEGKQNAVIRFLTEAAETGPQTLLLFSDEDMSWMIEPVFFKKWAALLKQVLLTGNRVRIIHTVTRGNEELSPAIFGWLPMYTTGLVEPYYSPGPIDGTHRRTLFIAPNAAAVTSYSVNNNIDDAVNLYITDQKTIEVFSKEYDNYLSACKPLLQVFGPDEREGLFDIWTEWFAAEDAAYLLPKFLSAYTLEPEELAKQLEVHELYEIITLPNPELVKAGKIPVPDFPCLTRKPGFYTPEEFSHHLSQIIHLIQTEPRYHVSMRRENPDPYVLYVKERTGMFAFGDVQPQLSFFMNEPAMTRAFGNYVRQKISLGIGEIREELVKELEGYLTELL